MAKASNMSAPVTRGELREELNLLRAEFREAIAPLATKAELAPLATKAELAQAIAPLATKAELELWGGALMARLDGAIQHLHRELQADLARHANALHEWLGSMLRAHDEKYTDLPGRVSRLESAVFTPKPR